MLNSQLSRRDFLKLASAGTLAFALKDLRLDRALAASSTIKHGRITWSGIPLYDAPFFNANKIHHFGADQVIEITSIDENGEQGNPFNSVWYQVNGEGYTYSGWVQPVETNYQKPKFNVPEKGQVGEITVPFSDTKKAPYVYAERGYRLFYGTTHWVKRAIITREEKSIWYEIYDFHLKKYFYVPSHDMRLVSNDELTLASPDVPDEEKSIVVDLSAQLVTAFEGEKLVFSQRCSSGAKGTETPKGNFRTYHKGPSVHMTNQGDAIENIYNLPGVPWCAFFTGAGNAFHGTYWHNDYGRPRSHGCVNLPSESAKFLYRWTKPNVPPDADYIHLPGEGTKIQIF
ncbi:MAG: L,D-transpeptidase family protein [Anaerolineae bacterium]|nr:L,D-transpeptidase family protein [Anaerolineae bacterium]MCI0609508.1 L,D-transpeptidase family protein [Anaerolineae bacterium]